MLYTLVLAMIEFDNVAKTYVQGKREVRALDGVTLAIDRGEFVAIMGPSGSGKSTLLHLAGALDLPSAGHVRVEGRATSAQSESERTLLRRRRIGFVFQFFNLVPTLTVEENVGLPLLLDGAPSSEVRSKVGALLERVGLRDRASHMPDELSGGEMQRAAISRALVTDPPIVLGDEPTGNLDSATGLSIMELLASVAEERKKTIVIVTHDPKIAAFAGRVVRVRDGKLDDNGLASR